MRSEKSKKQIIRTRKRPNYRRTAQMKRNAANTIAVDLFCRTIQTENWAWARCSHAANADFSIKEQNHQTAANNHLESKQRVSLENGGLSENGNKTAADHWQILRYIPFFFLKKKDFQKNGSVFFLQRNSAFIIFSKISKTQNFLINLLTNHINRAETTYLRIETIWYAFCSKFATFSDFEKPIFFQKKTLRRNFYRSDEQTADLGVSTFGKHRPKNVPFDSEIFFHITQKNDAKNNVCQNCGSTRCRHMFHDGEITNSKTGVKPSFLKWLTSIIFHQTDWNWLVLVLHSNWSQTNKLIFCDPKNQWLVKIQVNSFNSSLVSSEEQPQSKTYWPRKDFALERIK